MHTDRVPDSDQMARLINPRKLGKVESLTAARMTMIPENWIDV